MEPATLRMSNGESELSGSLEPGGENLHRLLFNAIDEGFCIVKVIFNSEERAVDYRFLEVNPAFARQTGLQNATGKAIRSLDPNHEEHWFATYGQVARTGQSVRFMNRAEGLHRWLDVYAFCVGHPANREIAILVNDVT